MRQCCDEDWSWNKLILFSRKSRYSTADGDGPALFICGPVTLSLLYVCADNSGHLHHVDRLAFFQICKVSDLA